MDPKLLSIFHEESQEIISALERGLISLEKQADSDTINEVFRAAHTMKGNAGIVGFENLVEITHLMEYVLDEIRQDKLNVTPEVISTLFNAVDALKAMSRNALEDKYTVPPAGVMDALNRILREGNLEERGPVTVPAAPSPQFEQNEASQLYRIVFQPNEDLFTTGTDPLQLIMELEDYGSLFKVEAHTDKLPDLPDLDPTKLYAWWEIWLESSDPVSTIENVFIFVQDESKLSIEPWEEPAPSKPQAPPPVVEPPAIKPRKEPPVREASAKPEQPAPVSQTASSIRVNTGKLDKLVDLVGEMVIGLSRVSQLGDGSQNPDLIQAIEELHLVSQDLQEEIMRVRMIPIEATFQLMQRMVRDLAAELGKKINLEITGAETELDKNVIERIADPLKHLIRNAIDHGLESPEERSAAGKSDSGLLRLHAKQQEGRIIIEVKDDGRGIDTNRIRRKMTDRGQGEQAGELSEQQLLSQLFAPGFSTAETVTELSGRGVGLDVVRQNIEDLHGSVELSSELGNGSVFRIKLPLTLAVIEGMKVRLGREILTIPLLNIVENIRPREDELDTVEGEETLIRVRDDFIPVAHLNQILNMPGDAQAITDGMVVVLESVSRRFGILVDEILGEQQAVIKSLDKNFRAVRGVAGATILGDGRVSLIIDVHGLEKMAFDHKAAT